ncbi:hypothetical protein [Algoriphagus sp. D3-2-R+10]|uniref:hypothetical protein n=1 Tax=Algoriphagus aurantiacus TaxID=3103948 RepID=UPI003A5D1865
MVGFLVFAVSLDLTWEKLLRALKRPKPLAIGIVAQFGILPAKGFASVVNLPPTTYNFNRQQNHPFSFAICFSPQSLK